MLQDLPYIRSSRSNKIRPKNGAEPLTVIRYTLMPNIDDSLEQQLKPYVEGNCNDTKQLAGIINSHFPKEMIDDMRQLQKGQVAPSRIYIIENIPEIDKEDVLKLDDIYAVPYKKSEKHTYGAWIAKGIAESAHYKNRWTEKLIRTEGQKDAEVIGGYYHKDSNVYSALSGLDVGNQNLPTTQFIDFNTLIDENHLDKNRDEIRASFSTDQGIDFLNIEKDLDAMSNKHSQEITVRPNMLVIWSDQGSVFHKALTCKTELPKDTITRIVLNHAFRR